MFLVLLPLNAFFGSIIVVPVVSRKYRLFDQHMHDVAYFLLTDVKVGILVPKPFLLYERIKIFELSAARLQPSTEN